MMVFFEKCPAEVWYVICAVATVAGVWLMWAAKKWWFRLLGILIILLAAILFFKGSKYSHDVLGHNHSSELSFYTQRLK